MKSWAAIPLAIVTMLCVSMPVAHANDIDDCNGDDTAKIIAGCTVIIDSGKLDKADLEAAYVARGIAYDALALDAAESEIAKIYDKAIADLDAAIKLNPKDANAHYNHGVVNEHRGDPDTAMKDYNTSLRLAPKVADTYVARGNVEKSLEDIEAALKDYQTALKLDPKNMDALFGRAMAYEDMSEKLKAMADYKAVIANSDDERQIENAKRRLETLQKPQ